MAVCGEIRFVLPMEAPFTGTLERVGTSGWIKKWEIYFHNSVGIKWHMQTTEMHF